MTSYTPNFSLDLYDGTDKPNLRDQYAAAMRKIDDQLKAAENAQVATNNNVATALANIATATQKADEASQQANKNADALTILSATVAGYDDVITSANANALNALDEASAAEQAVIAMDTRVTTVEATAVGAMEKATANETLANELQASVAANAAALTGKADRMHAAATNVHGLGSAGLYGHVKLDSTADSSLGDDSGTACTPQGVANAISANVNALKPTKVLDENINLSGTNYSFEGRIVAYYSPLGITTILLFSTNYSFTQDTWVTLDLATLPTNARPFFNIRSTIGDVGYMLVRGTDSKVQLEVSGFPDKTGTTGLGHVLTFLSRPGWSYAVAEAIEE